MYLAIKKKVRKHTPKPIWELLSRSRNYLFTSFNKKLLVIKMQKKHQQLLAQIQGKEKIKVIFLAIHKSVWKVDPVFKKMLDDPFFEPIILICPYTPDGEERMWQDMEDAQGYFEKKGYPLISSYNKKEQRWVALKEIDPDIVFFTNPHDLTRKEYYEDAYLNYLSCYVPYFFLTTTHDRDQGIYNHKLHNAMWKIFMPHKYSIGKAAEVSFTKAKNCLLTGYPACEDFIDINRQHKNVWKTQANNKKKIIFAPHHTIFEDNLQLSNFLSVSELIDQLVAKYKDSVQWSFKPHPLLKSKLYLHPLWGKNKTDSYYDFWAEQEFTQLDEGEYIDLFLDSDAIIHDCGSFIAEYLFVEKPCAYLEMNGDSQLNSINDFGKYALESYVSIKNKDNLVSFVESIAKNDCLVKSSHLDFFEDYIDPVYKDNSPSETILNFLKNSIEVDANK